MISPFARVSALVFAALCGLAVALPAASLQISDDPLAAFLAAPGDDFLITGATVFSGDEAAPSVQDVLIRDGRIVEVADVGAVMVGEGVTRIEGGGKSLIPGFVGMHNHLHMPGAPFMGDVAARLYLAAGVTTIQTAGSADPIGELRLARQIERGTAPGPRIMASAPYVTGPDGNPPMDKPASADAARRFVDEWADRGVHTIKLYRHTDPDIAATIIDQAHRRGLRVTGHLCSITYAEAAEMGIDGLEHGLHPASDMVEDKPRGACVPSLDAKAALDVDGPQIDALIETLVSNDVELTSTLAILESRFPHRPQADDRTLTLLAPHLAEASRARAEAMAEIETSLSTSPAYWTLLLAFERRFVEAGGRLLAGPDTGRHVLPGFGDQRNFELLREAGFSTSQTITIMSRNGAHALGLDKETGRIAPGYLADLILVDGDIHADPSAIRVVEIVFRAGQAFDPQRLMKGLEGQVGLP